MAADLTRDDVLAAPLADFPGWHLSIACPHCRLLVQLRCDDLARTLPGLCVDVAVARLRCSRCGGAPSSVVLADGVAGMGRAEVRRVELLEAENDEGPEAGASGP
jgi:hypothetical protein